jgi:hypothetical protein
MSYYKKTKDWESINKDESWFHLRNDECEIDCIRILRWYWNINMKKNSDYFWEMDEDEIDFNKTKEKKF